MLGAACHRDRRREVDYVIGLGANLGSRRANLEAALALLAASLRVTRCSPIYESAPVGPPQPDYLNAAVRVQSELDAHALLARLLAIESLLGRERSAAERWGPRTLDLDVLWAEQPVHSESLVIPHAHLGERWFALAPLLDVAPELQAEYGPALAAQGGRRAHYPEALGRQARGTARQVDGASAIEVAAEALHPADALADALGALGRYLAGDAGCGLAEAQVVGARDAGEAIAALVRAALDQSARGFAFERASIAGQLSTPPAALEGRLLGASTGAVRPVPGLFAAEICPRPSCHRALIRLAPSAPRKRQETGNFR